MIKILLFLLSVNAFAVTKVKPLYINSLAHSTQVSPTRDYLSAAGIVFLGDENTLISAVTGNIRISGSTAISQTLSVTKLQFSDGTSMTTASSGSGSNFFTDGGATTYLTSLTDNLAIGFQNTSAKLDINGMISGAALSIYGNESISGSSIIARYLSIGTTSDSISGGSQLSVAGNISSTSASISGTASVFKLQFSDGTSMTSASGSNADTLDGLDSTAFLKVANNLSDLSSASTARSNLGLGTMATQNSTAVSITGGNISTSGWISATGFSGDGSNISNVNATTISGATSASFLWRANNLSDLASASTARTNLGLGTMATQNSTAVSITGGNFSTSGSITASFLAGDGSNITNVNAALLGGQNGAFYLARANHTGTQLSTTISDFNEASQDAVAGILTNNAPISWTYDDAGNTITAGLNYNTTNLKLTSNFLNTIQDINSTATPTFGGLTSNGIISTTSFRTSDTAAIGKLQFSDGSSFTTAITSYWTDGGITTYLTSLTDNVGIGIQSAGAKLDVAGDISASGQLYFQTGMQTLGLGNGTATPNARGTGAIDLQTNRNASTQVASGNYSHIGGGQINASTGTYATVSGGLANTASGIGAFIGAGSFNISSGSSSTIAGGSLNTASSGGDFIGGGARNTASGGGSVIAGGGSNTNTGASGTIGGGTLNVNTSVGGVIAGGKSNNNAGATTEATIGGGFVNTNSTNAHYSTIAGGKSNSNAGAESFVGGGLSNTTGNTYATIAGGQNNTASGKGSSITGGTFNYSAGSSSTVGGGSFNRADGSASFSTGISSTATAFAQTTIGRFANVGSAKSAVAADAADLLFVIGNGTSTSLPKNAVTVDGSGSISAAGNGLFAGFSQIGVNTSTPISGGATLTVNGPVSITGLFTSTAGASITGGGSWDFATSNGKAYAVTVNNTNVANSSSGMRVDGFTNGLLAVASGGSGSTGYGMYGQNTNNQGNDMGVRGDVGTGATGGQYGGYFQARTSGTGATGAFGETTNVTIVSYGLYGKVASPNSYALYGLNTTNGPAGFFSGTTIISGPLSVNNATSAAIGTSALSINGVVSATVNAAGAVGTFINNDSSGSTDYGLYAKTNSTNAYALYGLSTTGNYTKGVVYGESASTNNGKGVWGNVTSNSGTANPYGVYGQALAPLGAGVFGINSDATTATGVGVGALGTIAISSTSTAANGYGLYSTNTSTGYAGFFKGNTAITGNLTVNNATSAALDSSALAVSGLISTTSLTVFSSNNAVSITGSLSITGPNQRLNIPSGGNNITGTCTLILGTCTVSNTSVTAASIILLTEQNNSGALGTPSISARTPGTSFVITSTSPTDTSLVGYLIIEP